MKSLNKILFFLVFVSLSYGQNRIAISKTNSISCDVNSIFNTDASSYGISISGILGPVEIGYLYSKFSSSDNNDTFTQNIPTVNLHLFRKNKKIPITLVIGGSLIKENYYIQYLKKYISDLRTEGYKLNGYIYHIFDTEVKNLTVTPLIGMEYYRYTLRGYAIYTKNHIIDEDQLINIRGQFSFGYHFNKSIHLYFDPCFTINNKKASAGIYFGMGYSFSKWNKSIE